MKHKFIHQCPLWQTAVIRKHELEDMFSLINNENDSLHKVQNMNEILIKKMRSTGVAHFFNNMADLQT